ncbi:MAG: hypothetical protein ACE5GX_19930, partial [Thermoanaerobaculia bacterium]
MVILPLIAAIGCLAPAPQVERPAASPGPPATLVAEPAPGTEMASIQESLTSSLVYLERDGGAWMRGESPQQRSSPAEKF